MPRISIMSDLHLDISHVDPILPGGDILVLAGDILEVNSITEPRHMKFFEEECSKKYEHIVMVTGNHESYHFEITETVPYMRDVLPDNFHILDNSTFEVDDIMFLGATLWTDCDRGNPITKSALSNGMNDFNVIRYNKFGSHNGPNIWSPEDAIAAHDDTLKYFKTVLENPANKDKKIVVVTHHAPTGLSIDKRYVDNALNGGYYSKLDDFILDYPQIKYYIHGHVHNKFDYMVGDYTRVICNPRGYVTNRGAEPTGWDPNFFIEI